MYVVERTYEGYKKEDKSTMVAETKELLVDELMGLFVDWYEPSDYPDRKDEGIKAIKDDDWEEGDWYDWEFDLDYLLSLEGDKIVEFFNRLSSRENFTLLYAKEGS